MPAATPRAIVGPLRAESAAQTVATLRAILASVPPDAAWFGMPLEAPSPQTEQPVRALPGATVAGRMRSLLHSKNDAATGNAGQTDEAVLSAVPGAGIGCLARTRLLHGSSTDWQHLYDTARSAHDMPGPMREEVRHRISAEIQEWLRQNLQPFAVLPGPEGNETLRPLLANLGMLTPAQRVGALGRFFDRIDINDPDPDQAFLCDVIGAVTHLPDPELRRTVCEALEVVTLLVAERDRDKPMTALLDLLPHLPPGLARCGPYLAKIVEFNDLPPAGRTRVLDHLVDHIGDLPEEPYRLAAISHLLLMTRNEREPASIRQMAAITAKVPLLPPDQKMLDVFRCIGQIAQLTSLPGRCTVLHAMAECLPELARHDYLKQGILTISRFGSLGDSERQSQLTAAIGTALLRVAVRIERHLKVDGAQASAIKEFSTLLDGAVIAPAALRDKVASAIFMVVEAARLHASPAFGTLRDECHRKLAPDICAELEFRLTELM